MTQLRWSEVEAAVPGLAAEVRGRFEAHPHHVLSTLHLDGRPRVSGSNVFFGGGWLWIGSMLGARKAADLRRDPRCALHSAPLEETLGPGGADARIEAVAHLLDVATAAEVLAASGGEHPGADEGDYFELLVGGMSLVTVEDDELRVRSWTPGQTVQDVRRA